MRDKADYSLYKCPYSHLPKECGHKLNGPENYDTNSIWCRCGFHAPVFYLDPVQLGLKLISESTEEIEDDFVPDFQD